jgi:hypothetical protein
MRHLDDLLSRLESNLGEVAREVENLAPTRAGQKSREWTVSARPVGPQRPVLTAQAEA